MSASDEIAKAAGIHPARDLTDAGRAALEWIAETTDEAGLLELLAEVER